MNEWELRWHKPRTPSPDGSAAGSLPGAGSGGGQGSSGGLAAPVPPVGPGYREDGSFGDLVPAGLGDVPWQGELRSGSVPFQLQPNSVVDPARRSAELAAFAIGEQAPRMRRREPDDTFPLPPWPRLTAAAAPAAPVGSDDGTKEHS
jgi:hypothetical protein